MESFRRKHGEKFTCGQANETDSNSEIIWEDRDLKQLICEMCGSTDLIKQDGVFVCQFCGVKYSVEEAKKMMVEGTVQVVGTVQVDDTYKIDNYYIIAENVYTANNRQEAENYCNKIIEIDPSNYKAWFLKGKAAGWQSTIYNIRIEESVRCFTKALDNSPKDALTQIKTEAASEIFSLSTAIIGRCCDNFAKRPSQDNKESIFHTLQLVKQHSLLFLSKCGVKPTEFCKKVAAMLEDSVCTAWKNEITIEYKHSEYPSKNVWEEFKNRCFNCIAILNKSVELSDDDSEADIQRYKNLIEITTELVNSCSYKYTTSSYHGRRFGYYRREWSLTKEAKKINIDNIMKYYEKIKEMDSSYEIPTRPKLKSGACYIATAVYGSYDCPQVWTLRRFRDNTLAKTWYGRMFIRIYYAISPIIIKWFGQTEWFKKFWRHRLDCIVSNLNEEGVADTPYKDKII